MVAIAKNCKIGTFEFIQVGRDAEMVVNGVIKLVWTDRGDLTLRDSQKLSDEDFVKRLNRVDDVIQQIKKSLTIKELVNLCELCHYTGCDQHENPLWWLMDYIHSEWGKNGNVSV